MQTEKNVLKQATSACSPSLFTVIFFSFFINLLMFVAPIHMLQIYDRVLMSRSEITLLVLTLLAVGLLVIYGFLEAVRSKILIRTSIRFDELMSKSMFNMLFDTAISQPRATSPQILRDVVVVRDFIGGSAIIALCDAPWVPIFIAVGFFIHPILGFVSLAGAIIIFVLALINELSTKGNLSEANKSNIAANNEAISSVRNAEVVKALGMIKGIRGNWTKSHDKSLLHQTVASDRAAVVVASSRFVRMALQVVILATGGYLAIQDEITPGMMIAASIIMGRALAPVDLAVANWRNFVSVRDAYSRLNQLLANHTEQPETMDLPAPTGQISVEGLYIRPPEAPDLVLNNVSLKFDPGSVTAIIGPSGCGKSTFVRALVGVWPAFRGHVRFDGADIRNWLSEKLGVYVGYMPQDVELFSGTIAENIARFQKIDSNSVVDAAKKAGVHQLILNLPEGYDTNIGIGGRSLSGGQRQRIALARALYKDPPIIVLDEPNASLDADGEKALADAINLAKKRGATVVLVSHRPSLLSISDRIAVLREGSMVKFGSRDEVLRDLGASQSAPLQSVPSND